jgi:hypothetical protein
VEVKNAESRLYLLQASSLHLGESAHYEF